MRRRMTVLLAVFAMLGAISLPASGAGAEKQSEDVLGIDDRLDAGDATLIRTNRGVTTSAHVDGAEPGVYTMWWVVWNSPESCFKEFECLFPDLFNPAADVAIGYAGGSVVGEGGDLSISAHLSEGRTLTGFPAAEFNGAFGTFINDDVDSLQDAASAEIHLVLRSHGELVPEMVGSAIQTFNGACVYEAPIAGTAPTYGIEGDNACVDLWDVIFPVP